MVGLRIASTVGITSPLFYVVGPLQLFIYLILWLMPYNDISKWMDGVDTTHTS
jgi:hypothetical protein